MSHTVASQTTLQAEYALSAGQRALWFLQQLRPDSPANHVYQAVIVRDEPDVRALEAALNRVIARHEALRTTFARGPDGEPVQRVHAHRSVRLGVTEAKGWDDDTLQEAILEEALRPFDLEHGPLVRAHVWLLGPERYALLLAMHHLITDLWSLALTTYEWGQFYAAERTGSHPRLFKLRRTYRDFVQTEAEKLASPETQTHLAFWREQFTPLPPALDLPADFPRPPQQSHEAGVIIQRLDAELSARLRALARGQGVSLHDLLLAAYQVLLHRYTGQTDLTTGVLRAGRTPAFARVIGYFINPLPLRVRIHPDATFIEHLAGMSRALDEGVAHEVPFSTLVEALQPPRDPARNPIFQALFSWQKTSALLDRKAVRAFVLHEADGEMAVAGVPLQSITLKRWVTQFDLSLMVGEGEDDLTLTLEYNVDILREGTARAMLQAYRTLLTDIIARPDAPITSLNLVDDAMGARLAAWGNVGREDAAEPKALLIHAWFERQASSTPDAIALALGDETITYAELDARANQIAHALIARGIRPEDRVALLLPPSFDMMAAILGVLKAGAAYVPLDPSYPAERLRYMIEDASVALVIGDQGLKTKDFESVLNQNLIFNLQSLTHSQPTTDPDIEAHPENAAYVIYTSGTTGRPKGVVVTHGNVTRLMAAAQPLFHFGPDDVWTLFHSYAFDFSVWEMWGALFFGGRLEIIPRHLARDPEAFYDLLARRGVTVLNQTPSAFRQLMAVEARRDAPADLALRWVIFGGEALDMTALASWFRRHGDRRPQLVNMYGITETTVHVTWRPISQTDVPRPASLIGPPLPHLSLHLLDAHGQPVPIGAVGEIYVGGAGLARGYLNQPALTAERFVPDPFIALQEHESTKASRREEKTEKVRENPLHLRHPRRTETRVAGRRLYRSGDLARWTPDGDLQFLGRADHQVKIRGFRVELGEIAAVLEQRDDVAAAVVLAWGDSIRTEGIRLAAYLAPAGPTPPDAEALRSWLAQRLPDYMIPTAYVILPQLPLTPQGKIDRRALPEPDWRQTARTGQSKKPATSLERELAAIWEDLLGVEDVGVEDDFFTLGGHSLLVIRLLARIEDRFRVHIPVQTFFDNPTIAALTEEIQDQRLKSGSEPPNFILSHQSLIFEHQPSPAQRRLWLIHQLDPDSPVYHIPAAVRLHGRLDLDRLEHAINRIIARHASLRTIFEEQDGDPIARILPELGIRLEHSDAVGETLEARLEDALRQARVLARKPFDLTRGPLLRAAVWRLDEDDHLLAFVIHHIIADGWSVHVFLDELQTYYQDADAQLPDLPVQYPDYAAWQAERLTKDALAPHLAFWRETLTDAPHALNLPTDRPRPPVKRGEGAVHRFHIPAALAAEVKELARTAGATPFMAFLAAFATLLSRYAGQDDLVIGTALANRPRPELASLIGYFVNTLPLRLHLDLDAPFTELLARVRAATLAAFAHQDTPFEAIVEAVQPPRDLGRTPLFQVMFSLQEDPLQAVHLPHLWMEPISIDTGTARYDLTLVLTESDSGLAGWLEYSTELWDEATIAGMMRAFRSLLASIVAQPQRPLAIQPLLSPEEARALTRAWNPPSSPFPAHRTIPDLFAAQVAAAPHAIAAEDGDRSLTYAELDARANQLAHALLARGLQPDQPVAVILRPGLHWLISLLGILKAGGAYLPIDPDYPPERIRYMLEDSSARLVISNQLSVISDQSEGQKARGQRSEVGSETLDIGHWTLDDLTHYALRITSAEVQSQPTTNPNIAVHPENAAYIIYTSGTTGQPKGVVISHRAVIRLVRNTDYLQVQPGQRVAQAANPAFDATTFEVWAPLLNGGTVVFLPKETVLHPDQLARFLREHRVHALFLTTALFNLIASQRADAFAPLETLLFGGQAVTPHWVRVVLDAGPPRRLLHVYGPTETTTFATWYEVTHVPEGAATVPIGLPIAHTTCHVVDEAMQPVPPGVVGMLFIGGPGLARGYLNRPALTAERFLPDPFAGENHKDTKARRHEEEKSEETRENPLHPRYSRRMETPATGQRLYRTGDLVRRRRDGAIEFIARADRQLKLRGFRIEPGEIEHALRGHPAIKDALVRAVTLQGRDEPILTAYLITHEPVQAEVLREYLARRLPDYMLPAAYLFLDRFPLNPNGKVDERALPLPDEVAFQTHTAFEPPQTELEQVIAGVWAELLGHSHVGRHDDFFALGGHSLLAARAVARLSQTLGLDITLRTLFEAPTPATLARKLAERIPAKSQFLPIPPLARSPEHPNIPLSFAQQRLWFLQQLDPDSSFYNIGLALEVRGPLDRAALEQALNHIIARHESLRTIFRLEGHAPVAHILPELQVSIPLYEAESLEEARALAELLARQPFRLSQPPLLRVHCYRIHENHHVLAFSFHHIIADGWSLGIMVRELAELYRATLTGEEAHLPALSIQYADFAAWQRQRLEEGRLEADLTYWREQLRGLPPATNLPTDYPRPSVQTFQGSHITFHLDAALTQRLRRLAQDHDATLFMVTLAAFQTLLHRYALQDDLAVGIASANRDHPQLEPLIGFFVNTLVARADFSDDPTFTSFLRRTRETVLQAFAHQEVPFDDVVEALQPPRDLARNPLVQTLFAFQNAFDRLPPIHDLDWRYLDIEPGTVKFDLTLSLAEIGDGLMGVLGYATDLFRESTARRFIDHYRALLMAIVAEPNEAISRLPMYAPGELKQILAWAHGPDQPLPAGETVVDWIQDQARARPDAIAVAAPLEHIPPLTYAQLDARANQVAHALITRGVQPGDIVGIRMSRSPEAMIALLGVLKAGAAYLPLDPSLPEERIRFMLEDSAARLVIRDQYPVFSSQPEDQKTRGQKPEPQTSDFGPRTSDSIMHHASRFTSTDDWLLITDSSLSTYPDTPPEVSLHPANLAYVIYTSGTTGRPKGVAVPHRALANYILAARDAFQLSPNDRVLQFAPLAFDAAVEEIFTTLIAGAALIIRNDEIIGDATVFLDFCREQGLTILDLPTAFWHFLADAILAHGLELPPNLRLIIIGGERARPDLLRRWLLRYPDRPIILNTYGPTEATVVATMWRAQPDFARGNYPAQVPIGQPVPNARVYVLDRNLHPTPIGVPGELIIAGPGLAWGYLNRPALTAEKFVPDNLREAIKSPNASSDSGDRLLEAGERMYRTGDLVRWLEDGRLEYLGRLDQQVKISGYRIEPEEVAAVLAEHPLVHEAAVLAEHHRDATSLIAFIIPNQIPPDPIELQDFLRLRLPGYMLPARIHIVDAFPRTPGGKVDAEALLQSCRIPVRDQIEPPRTPLERALVAMWEDVLDTRPIGIHDDFFALGGDSLQAAIFVNRLQEKLDQPVFVAVIFDAPTIAELAALLERDYAPAVARWLPEHPLPQRQHAITNTPVVTDADIHAFKRILTLRDYDDASEQSYRASLLEKLPPAIFILAAPRSGSTLLRVMLAGHPGLFAPPELYLASFHTMAERAAALSGRQRGWAEGLLRAIMELFHCDLDRARAILARYEAADWPIHRFYRRLQSWLAGRMLVDKTTTYPLSVQTLERIEATFQDARFIHLVRNPHASVLSYLNSGLDAVYLPDTPFTRRQRAELIWLHANRNIRDFLTRIPQERHILIHFEDLVQAPEAELHRLTDFLDISFDPAMLEPYREDRMLDGVHPESRMVGDPNFLRRQAIDANAANAWNDIPLDAPLHPETIHLATVLLNTTHGTPNTVQVNLAIPAQAQRTTAPLSFSQERLWFLARLQPDVPLYHMAAAVRLHGSFDQDAFMRSLDAIVARHAILRTAFEETDDGPIQRILPKRDLFIQQADLRHLPADQRLNEARRLAQELAARPFDLAKEPLLRVGLYRLDEHDHVIAVVMHHIIADGWSVGVFLHELEALYRANGDIAEAKLPSLPIQYADYAAWQREHLVGDRLETDLAFWREHLAGAPPLLQLPTDYPRPAVKQTDADLIAFHIPEDLARRVGNLARTVGVTPFMVFWGAFATLLARYANQEDIVIGTAVANRNLPELEPLIGFFVNTLPLRLQLHDNPNFHDLLSRIREIAQVAFAHNETPFDLVVDALQPPRNLDHTPIFQIMFAYQNMLEGPRARNLGLKPIDLDPVDAPYDLVLTLADGEDGLTGQWLYDASLFRPETIQRMTGHFLTLLDNLLTHPDRPIGYQPILTPEEMALHAAWNDTAAPLPEGLIPDLIARQARLRPDAPALTLGDQTLTYVQLDARANQIAHALLARGIELEDIVAIHLPRGPELLAAILGVMRSGAAFLALDPALPEERLRFMLEDSAARFIISDQDSVISIQSDGQKARGQRSEVRRQKAESQATDSELRTPDSPTNHQLLITDHFLSSYPNTPPSRSISPDNAAYVIYTSGTTGQPKAAVLTHGAFANFITDYARAFGLSPRDRMLQFASFAFDAALCESFMALVSGAELVFTPELVRLNPEAFTQFLEEEAITVALLTPTVLSRTRPPARGALRAVIAAGEACTWDIVRAWGDDRDFFNGYGPTEATIGCTYHRVRFEDAEFARSAPIGKPIANAQLHVLSPHGMIQPVGVPGELHIGGLPVGRGYLGRPALTAERFLPDPFAEVSSTSFSRLVGESALQGKPPQAGREDGVESAQPLASPRMYKTGDLVRRLPDGSLEFLGRVDRQVKFHGVRIEPGEIEAALRAHPAVAHAAVLLWQQDDTGRWSLAGPLSPGPAGDPWLVAYVATRENVTSDELRRHLAQTLPTYMLPARIHILDRLPMTPTGKVDARALPPPDRLQSHDRRGQPPANVTEQLIADIWRDLLGVSDIARDDDFFALGGRSLLAARVATRLSQALDRDIPLAWIFQHPTPAALAEKINNQRLKVNQSSETQPPHLIFSLRSSSTRDTAPLSFAQQRLWFLEHLEPGHPTYHIPLAVRLRGPLDPARLETALNRIIARHASLRTRFESTPEGPIQRVLPDLRLPLTINDLTALEPEARWDEARRLAREDARRPFRLDEAPLLRSKLYRLDEGDHLFTLVLHHIIADGWSVGVLLRELQTLYQNPDASLPRLPIQYPDYAAWQRQHLSGDRLEALLSFWRDHLADAPPFLDLPTDFPRPPIKTSNGDVLRFTIPDALARRLHALAREAGATPFMAFWGAFATLLAQWANQPDVVIGTAIANRPRPELEPLIGFFVNALALRLRLDNAASFRDLLAQARRTAQDAFAHAEAPFELVVDAVQPPRDLRITPIFQVALAYNQDLIPPLTFPNLQAEPLPLEADTAKYDLLLAVSDESGQTEAALQYSTDLWRPETIHRLADDFINLLDRLLAEPDAPLPLPTKHSAPATSAISAPQPDLEATPTALDSRNTEHSPTTALLLDLWRRALGRDDIGIHDNFFEIGGDSILITHILAQAQDLGLQLTARQFFQYPTIAQLAQHVSSTPSIEAEQGPVVGPVPLTPIQRWFFAQGLPNPHHWNQSILLEVAQPIDPDRLRQALAAVVNHHDMLRARFHPTPDGWVQEIIRAIEVPFQTVDLSHLPDAHQEAEAARLAGQAQTSLHLAHGPIFQMIHFHFGGKRPDRVLWIAHHLVVDGVSWRILLTDLLAAYGQLTTDSTVNLPSKTTSYRQWSQGLEAYARSGAVNAAKHYWLRTLPENPLPLPLDAPAGASRPSWVEAARYVDIALSRNETERLLDWTRMLSHAELRDALLWALGRVWAEWTGDARLFLAMEGQGRDPLGMPFNLNRTVGWFTTLYPLLLQLPDADEASEALVDMHRQANEAASHAQSYGILRYLLTDPDILQTAQPQVLFNFLGEVEGSPLAGVRFLTDPNARGLERGPDNHRTHLITITAMLRDGRLRFLWEYDPTFHQPHTIETLAQTVLHHLRTLPPETDDIPDDILDEIDA